MDLEEILSPSFDCCILWLFNAFFFFINPCFAIFHFLNKHASFFPCRLCWPNTWYDCQAQFLINPNSPISLPWNDKNLSKVKEIASFTYVLLSLSITGFPALISRHLYCPPSYPPWQWLRGIRKTRYQESLG